MATNKKFGAGKHRTRSKKAKRRNPRRAAFLGISVDKLVSSPVSFKQMLISSSRMDEWTGAHSARNLHKLEIRKRKKELREEKKAREAAERQMKLAA